MTHVNAIADSYVDQWAERDPLGATFAGISGHDDAITDLSPEGFAAAAELDRRTLAALAAAEPADEAERVAAESMTERLGLYLERYDAGLATSDLNVVDSPLQNVREVFDLMPTEGEEAVATIARRLARVPGALAGYRESLRQAAASGMVSAARQVRACAKHCADWTDPAKDDVYRGLAARLTAEGALRAELDAAAGAATRATAEFGRFLTEELLPKAPAKDAAGPERYALASRYFLGATVDQHETYAWGWEELDRIETEMRQVAGQLGCDSISDAIATLDADPARRIAGKEAFRDWMQQLADKAISELHGSHFDIPEPVRRIQCMIAPTSTGGIYYTGPSEDFTRPGRMWWAVPEGTDTFSTWQETTTVYHEGVPGHHLQVGQAAYQSQLLNRWQRKLCWVSGHGEGWALYAERLMSDLGYLDDPGDRLGMLAGQALRATRVIIDIGMHLELEIPYGDHKGERWTPELGWEFLLAHGRMEEPVLRYELDRYLGWPAQAPSYKVGERIWLQARDDAKHRAGPSFDLKTFHHNALNLGSLGLAPLRQALSRL